MIVNCKLLHLILATSMGWACMYHHPPPLPNIDTDKTCISAVKLEMATTVFGTDDADLSEHSSLISEGSAIAEIERELQEVVAQTSHRDESKQELHISALASFTTPPLHLYPSYTPSDDDIDDDDASLSVSPGPHSSPGYIPTACEQRSVFVSVSGQASLTSPPPLVKPCFDL